MRYHTRNWNRRVLIGLIFCGLISSISFGQNVSEPVWFNQHTPESGVVSGYGNGPDLTAAVLTALGEMGRQVEVQGGDEIITDDAEGMRNIFLLHFGRVAVLDTAIIMTDENGEREFYRTIMVFRPTSKYFKASQTQTIVGETTQNSWEIRTSGCSINDVLNELQTAGIDIKMQVVPDGAGYQYYLRLQTESP